MANLTNLLNITQRWGSVKWRHFGLVISLFVGSYSLQYDHTCWDVFFMITFSEFLVEFPPLIPIRWNVGSLVNPLELLNCWITWLMLLTRTDLSVYPFVGRGPFFVNQTSAGGLGSRLTTSLFSGLRTFMLYWRLRILSINLSALLTPYLRISLQPPARSTVCLDCHMSVSSSSSVLVFQLHRWIRLPGGKVWIRPSLCLQREVWRW